MNDFKASSEDLKTSMKQACARVIDSGWYIMGEELNRFEQKWAQFCQSKFCIGVGNGLDAIELSLRALGVGEGDEVITTSMTAFPTVLAIFRCGANPVLADIDPETGLMNLDSAQRCLTKKTKSLVYVHLYGQIKGMAVWEKFCKVSGISLIEDCAQAHGAKEDHKIVGSFGDAGAFSFYPTKNLGAIGDAGAVVTQDEELSKMIFRLRNYGQSERYHHPELGANSRLDEIQAAMLVEKLQHLENQNMARMKIAKLYHAKINNPKIKLLSKPRDESSHVYHLFVLKCDQREELQRYMKDKGVQTLIHYPLPIQLQRPCRDLLRDPKGLGKSEVFGRECLSIPCHPSLSTEEMLTVIDVVNGF
jgi:dTDP-4-amino-4,6-dideoxygalactose transaminase